MKTNPLRWKKAKIYSRKSQENVKQLDRHFHFIAFLLFVAFSVGIALPFFFKGATFVSLTGFFSPWVFCIFFDPPPSRFLIDRIGERRCDSKKHQSQSAAGQRKNIRKRFATGQSSS